MHSRLISGDSWSKFVWFVLEDGPGDLSPVVRLAGRFVEAWEVEIKTAQ